MRYQSILGVVLLALVLVVAACAPPAAGPTTIPPTDAPIAASTEEPAAADFPTPTVEVFEAMPEEVTEVPAQGAVALAHADAPASPDAYRFDDSSFVGTTGTPQLVEFFTTW